MPSVVIKKENIFNKFRKLRIVNLSYWKISLTKPYFVIWTIKDVKAWFWSVRSGINFKIKNKKTVQRPEVIGEFESMGVAESAGKIIDERWWTLQSRGTSLFDSVVVEDQNRNAYTNKFH